MRSCSASRAVRQPQPIFDVLRNPECDPASPVRRKHAAFEVGDAFAFILGSRATLAVAGDGALCLSFQCCLASIELIRRGQHGVRNGRNGPPYEYLAIGRGGHVAPFIDHVDIVRQCQPHPDEPLLQVFEG